MRLHNPSRRPPSPSSLFSLSASSPSLSSSSISLLLLPLLLPSLLVSATSTTCDHVLVDKESFDLSSLGGPRTVTHSEPHPPGVMNSTFTLDICKALKPVKETPKEERCPLGTWVCGIQRLFPKHADPDDKGTLTSVIPIAGDFQIGAHRPLNSKWTLLSSSRSSADAKKEGVRLELHGGLYSKRAQEAVIEFICDPDRTGLEGEEEERMVFSKRADFAAKKDDEDEHEPEPDEPDEDDGKDDPRSLRFLGFGPSTSGKEKETDVLRLEWRTKYACEGKRSEDKAAAAARSWGFFTWFIIVVFLATATYLIFGSWLNYNRYGARGWDLVPHGDTIRDVPYLLKDFTRRAISTVQGGGSRGGYSAV